MIEELILLDSRFKILLALRLLFGIKPSVKLVLLDEADAMTEDPQFCMAERC